MENVLCSCGSTSSIAAWTWSNPPEPLCQVCVDKFFDSAMEVAKEHSVNIPIEEVESTPAPITISNKVEVKKPSCSGFKKLIAQRGRPATNALCANCGVMYLIHPKN